MKEKPPVKIEKAVAQEGIEPVLHVFSNRSILVDDAGEEYVFTEGATSQEAKARLVIIKAKLAGNFLEDIIVECQDPKVKIEGLKDSQVELIEKIVNSVTSETGRAIVGLTVLQLTVKAILPEQSIRLHKGGHGSGSFSWKEGIPMRILDNSYITPVLRKYDLLKLNRDGFMMTRSLAENYPYSKLYKAYIQGARLEWQEITDLLERGELEPLNALKQMIVFLYNKSEAFLTLADGTLTKLTHFLYKKPTFEQCYSVASAFVNDSTYSARVFEVSMHAFMQVLGSQGQLEGFLKPLSQMRSANKKHGNIGDIEIVQSIDAMDIIESWDAKFGKTYLRDELEELNDKLKFHPQIEVAGFVTDQDPNLKEEIITRMQEIASVYGADIQIMNFKEWVEFQINKYNLNRYQIGAAWLIAIAESICQRRREIAPIDEPTTEWVETFANSIR